MVKLNNLEKIIKKKDFKENVDYKVDLGNHERAYLILSERLRGVVSPFSREGSEISDFVVMSRKKVEKDSVTGECFVYEENADGLEFDKLVITKSDNLELGVDKRVKEINQIDEKMREVDKRIKRIDKRVKEIDEIPVDSGKTFSFTRRKFNEKGEVVKEEKKIESQKPTLSPEIPKIQEITDEEAKRIEVQKESRHNNDVGGGKGGLGSPYLYFSGVVISLIGLVFVR